MRSNQPPLPTVRVLVADNSLIHTELLAQALGKDRRIRVVEVSATASGVLAGVTHSNPEVLLISESLDHDPTGGLKVLSEIRTERPDMKAVVLLDSPRQEDVIQAFRSGARGIFCRDQPVKMLCKCIAVVNEGQVWASTQELDFLLQALAATPSLPPANAPSLNGLSERERDVVCCLAQGLSNREIAVRLAISQHTVKNYMFRIFEKLGVSSRVELLFFVLSRNADTVDLVKRSLSNPAHENRARHVSEEDAGLKKKSTSINHPTLRRRDQPQLPGSSAQVIPRLGSG